MNIDKNVDAPLLPYNGIQGKSLSKEGAISGEEADFVVTDTARGRTKSGGTSQR